MKKASERVKYNRTILMLMVIILSLGVVLGYVIFTKELDIGAKVIGSFMCIVVIANFLNHFFKKIKSYHE